MPESPSRDGHIKKRGPRPQDPDLLRARGAYDKHPDRDPERGKEPPAPKPKVRPYAEIARRYAEDVRDGRVVASKLTRLACERHLRDLGRERTAAFPYYFDQWAAARKCARIESFAHVKGKWARKKERIVLGPWQVFAVVVLFGWRRVDNRLRRFRAAYLRVARKNGKSLLAAGIGLAMFFDDDEHGAEVYAGATTEKQAWEVFGPARLMLKAEPEVCAKEGLEVWARALVRPSDNSKFWPVIGNPGDGPGPSCAIVDEYHEHDTSALVDTMVTGMIAREQPLLLVITTAGTNLASPCYDMDRNAIRVLEGTIEDEELFAIIYTIDENDDWTDPRVLEKANPNIDVSADRLILEAQQRQAAQNPAQQNRFKTKHLDVWCNAPVAGINSKLWADAADPTLRLEDFRGEEAIFSLDLASKLDICAFIQLFARFKPGPKGVVRHWYALARFYLPEDTITKEVAPSDRANQEAYRRWLIEGYLLATPGAELDFASVRDDVLAAREVVSVKEITYDPWRATQLAQEFAASGATTVEFPQGAQHMAVGFDELNAALASGRFHHQGNPVFAWMAANTVAKSIAKGLTIPAKEKQHLKIDGVVGVSMALSRGLVVVDDGGIEGWLKDPIRS